MIDIVSQSANNIIEGSPTCSAFMGSKAALTRITEAVAHDARPYGVFVFAMRPGSAPTALVEKILNDLGDAANDIPETTWTSLETAGDIVAFIATALSIRCQVVTLMPELATGNHYPIGSMRLWPMICSHFGFGANRFLY